MKGRLTVILAVLGLSFGLLCASAYATSGTITACVDSWGLTHILLKSGQKCSPGQTTLTWNAAGSPQAGSSQSQPIQALHLNSGIPFNAGSRVQLQVLCCDEPVSLLITGYYLQYDSTTGQPYQTNVSETRNFTSADAGTTPILKVPGSVEFILTDVVATFVPASANNRSSCGSFYGNILQDGSVKTTFAFSDL
ncbi:MAG: hypothetical protein M0Z81_10255 [Deltaproteobacteria bacterium]|nr:hypothetical protein [Deltaproteobacteria bacterium]